MIFGENDNLALTLPEILWLFLVIQFFLIFLVALTIIVTILTMGAVIVNLQHFGEGLMQRLASSNSLAERDRRGEPEEESYAFEARRR